MTHPILSAAYDLAARDGWQAVRRDAVAQAAGVSAGTVSNAYGSLDALRDEVMRMAVSERHARLVLEGIVARHPAVAGADATLRAEALAAA
ncbi:MAG TPA: TetR family transcriptional regulator [Gammaproteobacteria bacterium]|nr:TetR family transcriptional regulator [Gammaproteobacteria bacterium]